MAIPSIFPYTYFPSSMFQTSDDTLHQLVSLIPLVNHPNSPLVKGTNAVLPLSAQSYLCYINHWSSL